MSGRSIQVAAVQMDLKPAPTDERLFRADQLICDSVELGADLVVLPELFNTGYIYTDENFQRAEPPDGTSVSWLKRTARRRHAHLAATLLLRDGADIFNAMFIVSPDGRTWRYDKSYPWGYERGYFRETRAVGPERAVVAHTDLGDLGMLVCWDIAHTELWQAYAGKVDMMVICSCPPQVNNLTLWLPDNHQLNMLEFGPNRQQRKVEGQQIFETMLNEQTAWLGVPAVNSVGCGLFESPLPRERASLLAMAAAKPSLLRYLSRAGQVRISANVIDACKVVSAQGKPIARIAQSRGEAFTIADVTLANDRPQPSSSQPAGRASRLSVQISDGLLPALMRSTYQHKVQKFKEKPK